MTGRIQLALNVDDLDESISFYRKLFGTEPAKVRPGYANFAIADPRSSSSCWRTAARAAASTTSASRFPAPTPSRPSRLAWPRPGWPRSTSATPPAATPGRTSSGYRAPRTGSGGRSTRSWRTVPPSGARIPAAVGRRPRPRSSRARPVPRRPRRAAAGSRIHSRPSGTDVFVTGAGCRRISRTCAGSPAPRRSAGWRPGRRRTRPASAPAW